MKQARSSRRFVRRAPARPGVVLSAIVLLIGLSGCSGLDFFDRFGNSTVENDPAGTFDPGLADPDPDNTPATGAASPRTKPAPPETDNQTAYRAPISLDPGNLVGLVESDAELLFGPPHFVIRQQPATRWHYVSQACTLDLFFFEDIETRVRRVLAYDVGTAAPREADEPSDDGLTACANSIRAERNDRTG